MTRAYKFDYQSPPQAPARARKSSSVDALKGSIHVCCGSLAVKSKPVLPARACDCMCLASEAPTVAVCTCIPATYMAACPHRLGARTGVSIPRTATMRANRSAGFGSSHDDSCPFALQYFDLDDLDLRAACPLADWNADESDTVLNDDLSLAPRTG